AVHRTDLAVRARRGGVRRTVHARSADRVRLHLARARRILGRSVATRAGQFCGYFGHPAVQENTINGGSARLMSRQTANYLAQPAIQTWLDDLRDRVPKR